MVLQVFLAHTGQRLEADPSSFTSLDSFKAWVAKHSTVAAKDHISLSPLGKPIRYPGLLTETEVFVYDGRMLQVSSSGPDRSQQSIIPIPPKYHAAKPPDTIADQNDLQAWQDLFMVRRSWVVKVVDDCEAMAKQATQRYNEVEIITRGVDAAVLNLEKHVKALDQKNADIQGWAVDIRKEQDLAGADWEKSMNLLRSIPATSEMIYFITGRDFRKNQKRSTLEELIDIEDVKAAGKIVSQVSTQLSRNGAEIGAKVDEVLSRTDMLFEQVEKSPARSAIRHAFDPAQLMQDIEPIAKKVSNDYESVLGYQNTAKSISQASKTALSHTKNLLPNLSKRNLEMDDMLRNATELRNVTVAEALDAMHNIAALTTMVGEANARFTAMDLGASTMDAFSLLSTLNALPAIYASFVAEAIRRKEWNDKIRFDSSTLANEMATFQDEEGKRRRRWQKSFGSTLWGDRAERKVVGIEVNLLGDEEAWPQASRQDLDELLENLRSQDARSPLATEIAKILADLNNPTKQQSRRTKAFKAGSIHEAALGRSALLVRGDDDLIRVLQEEKQKVEGRLKTAESRVRRLEDLLHRQSHISRASTGNVFQIPGSPGPENQYSSNSLVSPRVNEDLSRRSSVSSRRFSANHGVEEKAMQQKLLSLETDLISERERASGLENEVSAQKNAARDLQGLVDEVNSTKRDLMENFEAQQREFVTERTSLEEEIKRLKAKVEELDDEMDRYLGSRENERTTVDERVRILQEELDKARKEFAAEAQKAQGQVDFLRNDAKMQREANDSMENQLQKLKGDNRELVTRAQNAELIIEEQWRAIRDVHAQLCPKSPIPEEFATLAEVLASRSGDLVAELESVKSDATIARSGQNAAYDAVIDIKSELDRVQLKLSKEGIESSQLRETLKVENAKFEALEAELVDERGQLSTLRTKIADGEVGSEALRSRIEEEEKKVTSMSEDLAVRLSRIGGLEEEMRMVQDKYQSAQTKYESLLSRFDVRTSHTKDITQRVYAQNDRLCRLLERLSYSVTRDGASMIIQRMPKPDRSNANDSSDPGSTLRRSVSGAMNRKSMVDSGDLDLLYWMHNDDSKVESEKYNAYLNAIGNFDTEAFCEAITKRIKDMEYTAKKYSKDARAYRDKSHMAQKEAHEKIAFKNFKEGDLALFLPTRNQATGAWAAFNVGAPHYFLREQDSHKLRTRDWLLARIHKIEDRVVDLSKSLSGAHLNALDTRSFGEASNGGDSFEDDNPFDLSDGLRWYLIDAAEEKPGAPSTPGLGKSTVASAHIDATGSIRQTKKSPSGGVEGINKTLSKSLDSRRNSTNSKRNALAASPLIKTGSNATDTASLKGAPTAQLSGEGSDAQLIRTGSKQDVVDGLSKGQPLENIAKSNPTSTGTSPGKKSIIWDSLWSLDLSLENGKNKK